MGDRPQVPGLVSASYVDVRDSNNVSATDITAATSINSGNNTKWVFTAYPVYWRGVSSGLWSTATNWSTGIVPLPEDDVIFDGSDNDTSIIDLRSQAI